MNIVKQIIRRLSPSKVEDVAIEQVEPVDLREVGRNDEIDFWRGFCASERFIENFCVRVPNPEMNADVELFIKCHALAENRLGRVPKVLDIGSGPVSMLSHSFVDEKVELHAADPLASDYLTLWNPEGYKDLVLPVECAIEELSQTFGRDEFDVTHIRNALDHTASPLKGLDEMLHVTKPGGFLIVHGFANEAREENWCGFHQWNLCWAEGNDFTITGKDGVMHSVAAYLGNRARILRPWMGKTRDDKSWCGFIAQKSF
ncbi:class I SAM-dependent methyltransferase [Allorhizobium undicola]|uniref:class I SAM-dependent methyltransferase n=1 Tax=Allorhizobium undicola TaxID=78527 RepID=UPI000A06E547|nr:methyltransferase domain-containing protein [Allorhizobium undicola]